jgi:hypothetical protein
MTETPNESVGESTQEWEHKEDSCYSEREQETYAHLFKRENQYFTPENRESMEEIASLCNGHPGAAILAGMIIEINILINYLSYLTMVSLIYRLLLSLLIE